MGAAEAQLSMLAVCLTEAEAEALLDHAEVGGEVLRAAERKVRFCLRAQREGSPPLELGMVFADCGQPRSDGGARVRRRLRVVNVLDEHDRPAGPGRPVARAVVENLESGRVTTINAGRFAPGPGLAGMVLELLAG